MGNKTPSSRRRQGRNDFDPHCGPLDFCPYKSPQWGWESYQKDYLDGWEEARKMYEVEKQEDQNLLGNECAQAFSNAEDDLAFEFSEVAGHIANGTIGTIFQYAFSKGVIFGQENQDD